MVSTYFAYFCVSQPFYASVLKFCVSTSQLLKSLELRIFYSILRNYVRCIDLRNYAKDRNHDVTSLKITNFPNYVQGNPEEKTTFPRAIYCSFQTVFNNILHTIHRKQFATQRVEYFIKFATIVADGERVGWDQHPPAGLDGGQQEGQGLLHLRVIRLRESKCC